MLSVASKLPWVGLAALIASNFKARNNKKTAPKITSGKLKKDQQNHNKKVNHIKKLDLRLVNVLISIFALMLSFLVEVVEDTGYGYSKKLVGIVSLLCIVVAVLMTHVFLGRRTSASYRIWQPFIGGWKFVTAQSVGWALLSVSLLIVGISLAHPSPSDGIFGLIPNVWVTASTLGVISEVFLIGSLGLFQSPTTTTITTNADGSGVVKEKKGIKWNDLGAINIVISLVSLLAIASLERFRHSDLYTEQLHTVMVISSLSCILLAVAITHLLVGKMLHGPDWKWYHPFVGGWRHVLLQGLSWAFFGLVVLTGAWSMRSVALSVQGTWVLIGILGFLSELLMVVSIQLYDKKVEEKKKTTPTPTPARAEQFRVWLTDTKKLVDKARIFLVTVMIFNMFYAPVAFCTSAAVSFLITPTWLMTTLICLLLAGYFTTYFTKKPHVTGEWSSQQLRDSFLIGDIIKYFSGKVVKTSDIDASKQYIFGYHPHGILPIASMWSSTAWRDVVSDRETTTLISSHLFRVPIARDFLAAVGAREVSRIAFHTALNQGKSVILVPGGVKEMRHADSQSQEIAICTSHKGFIKMAITHGVDLVPMFSFGENKLLDTAFPKLQKLFWKYVGLPFPLFIGRWGLPIPRQQEITVVLGEPISITKVEEPSQADVDEISNEYFARLVKIFEENKAKYGHPETTLKFID
eukprot:TRINITY_DN730_c2_g2_i1.p1 TRINITY_DN730_c2_g2~~TRINITY_DN730_c2_g2_i1.p1  ORF type:complete len:692 (-),score=167.96 TRINITY_DN730_c2_g2_i1:49-2124(-)